MLKKNIKKIFIYLKMIVLVTGSAGYLGSKIGFEKSIGSILR
jgi:hypothetical protein